VIRQLITFVVGSGLGALALATVYFWREGVVGVWKVLAAAGLCVVPGAVALVWVISAQTRSASQQLLATFGGMLIRMVVALAGGVIVYQSIPQFQTPREQILSYWMALLLFYVGTLALETVLASRRRLSLGHRQHG
jgi:hypothetical protein